MGIETTFDPEREPASAAVIRAITVATNTDPLRIAPLFSSIDPDALDALFHRNTTGHTRVSFTHSTCQIDVYSDGRIRVTDATEAPSRSR